MDLVYEWDSNCQRIHDRITETFKHIASELGQLEHDENPDTMWELLNYYKKWHYNSQLYKSIVSEIISRKTVLTELLQKGYGVSTALAGDLESFLSKEADWYGKALDHTFYTQLEKVKSVIYMPENHIQRKNSWHIIAQLCRKLGLNEHENIPVIPEDNEDIRPEIDAFFNTSKITPPHANIATLLKMFLSMTEQSGTIMSGSIGNVNVDPAYRVKFIASKNLRQLFDFMYNIIDQPIRIDLNFIMNIHYRLTRELDLSHTWNAGEFRTEDFTNKSGLTFEFDNFRRGMEDMERFLENAQWNTDSFEFFCRQLVMLYYMLISIHPFTDSNGRTAKSLINFLMLKRGLVPITFDTYDEIPALHRYGGSPFDMEKYFKSRIKKSVHFYFEELERLKALGLTEKHFFNIDFDCGFYFRQLNGMSPGIEINFKIYEVPNHYHIYGQYIEKCKITVPSKENLSNLKLYYGFTATPFGDWLSGGERDCDCITYKGTDHYGINVWEGTVIIPVDYSVAANSYLELSLFNSEINFNNKGLNYRYELDRFILMKILAQFIKDLAESGKLEHLRHTASKIEWRSAEAINACALNSNSQTYEKQMLLQDNPDIFSALENEFIPLTLNFIIENGFSGRYETSDPDNMAAVEQLIKIYLPKTAWIMGL